MFNLFLVFQSFESPHRSLNGKPTTGRDNFFRNSQFCSLRRSPNNNENPSLFLLFYLGLPSHISPLFLTSFLQSGMNVLVDNCLVVERVWFQEAIDFVPCVGVLIARKSKGLPFILTFRHFNSHFFLTVVFFFLLQCFNL